MQLVPMDADETGNEQFISQLFVLVPIGDVADCVLEEEGVAGGFVDDAVEDVGDDFALHKMVSMGNLDLRQKW